MKQQQERVNALNKELSSCPYIEDFETSYIDILKGDYGSDYINEQGKKIYLNMLSCHASFFSGSMILNLSKASSPIYQIKAFSEFWW